MTTEEKVFQLLESTNLNWSVSKKALISEDGLRTHSNGIFRGEKWLGTVGERYVPMQNSELAMTIVKASDSIGINTTRGGELNGGTKVYLQAELPDALIGRSVIKRYITALNSHDGSTSIGFGSSNTVVVCQNTFFHAYRELSKFKHTLNAQQRIETAIEQFRIAMGFDDGLIVNYKRMADMELKDEIVERVIRKIFGINADDKLDTVSKIKQEKLANFSVSVEKSIQEQGSTVWSLFNGITRYTNHVLPTYLKESKIESSLMDGSGYEISNIGFDEIMAYVEENTSKQYA